MQERIAAIGSPRPAELARRVGVRQDQITRWLAGDTSPMGENLLKLCRVLGVSPGYLFGADEEQQDELTELAAQMPKELRPLAAARLRELVALAQKLRAGGTAAEPEQVEARAAAPDGYVGVTLAGSVGGDELAARGARADGTPRRLSNPQRAPTSHEIVGPAGGRAKLAGPAPTEAPAQTPAKGGRGGRNLRR